jgi:hypothetical protein
LGGLAFFSKEKIELEDPDQDATLHGQWSHFYKKELSALG